MTDQQSSNSTVNVSGGVNVNPQGDSSIQGDVVGRDKIQINIGTVVQNLETGPAPHQDETREAIQKVMAACYRRAVFTRTHAQLSIEAMIASLVQCRSVLQQLVIYIQSKEMRQLVVGIIRELDIIERYAESPDRIDEAKLRIINSLLQLSKLSNIPYELPTHLTEDVFFTEEEASKAPLGGD